MLKPPAKKPSAIAKKSAARLTAVQLIYAQSYSKLSPDLLLQGYKDNQVKLPLDEGEELIAPDMRFLSRIVRGVLDQKTMFDEMISAKLGPKNAQTEVLIKSILLCGAYELFAENDIDTGIIISDYLHVTEAFFDGSETKIVHGVLDALGKDMRAS